MKRLTILSIFLICLIICIVIAGIYQAHVRKIERKYNVSAYNCMSNMKTIYDQGLSKYAHDNRCFPDSLYELFKQGYISDISKFSCVKPLNSSLITSQEQFNELCDYIYLGKGRKPEHEKSESAIILIDKMNNHKMIINVLFANGVCTEIKKKNLDAFCKEYNFDYNQR